MLQVLRSVTTIGRRWVTSERGRQSSPLLEISPSVRAALDAGEPVVALESTIITHGMPYPHNLQTARDVEKVIIDEGAVPATIALLEGKMRVGLTERQLQTLAETGPSAVKCSVRDIPLALSRGWVGSTTVASTMRIAHMAGIRVFVTGGIGGVHRGAESTMDISADLMEMGRTPVAVVCAGVKSILDISKTLEVLETQGVPVLCYRTDRFPAFFTPDSGLPAPARVDSIPDIASCVRASFEAGLPSGLLIAVPNPSPAHGIQKAIDEAVSAAADNGLAGKDVTPFILQRVADATEGESLRANVALVMNNAEIGAALAMELAGPQGHVSA